MIEEVPASAWQEWIDEHDGVVVDVREPAEWAQGVLPESIKISLAFLPASLGRIDKDRPVLVACRAGNRSLMAAQFLQRNGFRAANLSGGLLSIGLA